MEHVYVLPVDLYKDWKDLMYTKELFENIVKDLKELREQAITDRFSAMGGSTTINAAMSVAEAQVLKKQLEEFIMLNK